MTTHHLKYLFRPGSVALAGASAREGSLGRAVLDNLRRGGFAGPIMLINPRYQRIADQPCFENVSHLPQRPDLLIVAAPRQAVCDLIEEAAKCEVRQELFVPFHPGSP